MPSPKDEIFTEISKDFNIRWNFPNCIESIDASTSEFTARRHSVLIFRNKNCKFLKKKRVRKDLHYVTYGYCTALPLCYVCHTVQCRCKGFHSACTVTTYKELRFKRNFWRKIIRFNVLNPWKTKRRMIYLKTQSVPRCKHFSSRL